MILDVSRDVLWSLLWAPMFSWSQLLTCMQSDLKTRGPLTCDIQIMWVVEVQVPFTLQPKGLRDQRDSKWWMYNLHSVQCDTKWILFHVYHIYRTWKAWSAENNSPKNAKEINWFIKYFVKINKNEVNINRRQKNKRKRSAASKIQC